MNCKLSKKLLAGGTVMLVIVATAAPAGVTVVVCPDLTPTNSFM